MRYWILIVLVFVSGFCLGQDFMRYSSVVDRIDLDILEDDSLVSFDKMGIMMYNGKYDADLALKYGLLCYDRYKETNNYHYFLKLDEQCQFVFGGKSDQLYGENAGTAVRIKYDTLDLKGPRYSAYSQGLALSLVLRFSTKEDAPRITKYIDRVFKALVNNVQQQGMLDRTNEGLVWLEEFPNSHVARHTLKGMLVGLIGILEYTTVRKDNILAKRLADDLLNSLITRIGNYNDLSKVYSSMNREKGATIGDQRELIFLFKHLYELTNESAFIRQAGLIAALMGHKSTLHVHDWDLFYSNVISAKGKLTGNAITYDQSGEHRLMPQERLKVDQGFMNDFPWFIHTFTNKITVREESMLSIEAESENDVFHVLYRYSWNPDLIDSEPWNALRGTTNFKHSFGLAPGYYQFMTIHENKKRDIPLKVNSIKPIKK